jgi:hypothetical protein
MAFKLEELEAERAAEEVIEDRKLDTLPICPFAIAKSVDIEVQPKVSADPGVSGFLMRVENGFGIGYATHIKSDGFIRFSVAHELGHYFIPGHPEIVLPEGQTLHSSRSGYVSGDPTERQADVFATTVLMPESLFLPALRNAGVGFEAIASLAETCRTSITATAIRFARYAEDPVAVLLSNGQTIEWCFMSDALREVEGLRWIKKGTSVPLGSETAKFNRVASNVSSGRKNGGWASLDDWFDGAPQVEMKEDVIGLGTYGRTLTVLFTEEAIDTDDDTDPDDDD